MAWTTPRSWTAGETVTSTILNTHVRDNLNAIASPPYAYVRASNSTTVGASDQVAISFNTEVADTDNMFSSGVPTRLTISTAGLYLITGGWSLSLTASHIAEATIGLNGGLLPHSSQAVIAGATTYNASVSTTCFYRLSAGDYLELYAYTTRTSVSTLTSNSNMSFMQARWMGP